MTTLGAVIFSILNVLFICLVAFIVENTSDGLPVWLHVILSPFYIVIAVLVSLCLILPFSYDDSVPDPLSSEKVEIYSIGLNTSGEVHGNFVLGCGSVNGETYPTYRFYTMSDNRYHLNEVNANNFDIVCTDTIEPCIVYNATRTMTYPVRMKWFWKDTVYTTIEEKNMSGIIYIPTNSIVQSYKIQL